MPHHTGRIDVTHYAALLRGINLGARRRIAMADLRDWLGRLGYTDVRTLLQSGNAVFRSDKEPDEIVWEIEGILLKELGFAVDCVLRTGDELRATVAAEPFGALVTNPSRLFVYFLSAAADPDRLPDLDPACFAPERFHFAPREFYLWCPDGVHDSPLAKQIVDKRLGVITTARNWNTVVKLADLTVD
jgi:uncharacterized protein (DUF1697 family)